MNDNLKKVFISILLISKKIYQKIVVILVISNSEYCMSSQMTTSKTLHYKILQINFRLQV